MKIIINSVESVYVGIEEGGPLLLCNVFVPGGVLWRFCRTQGSGT